MLDGNRNPGLFLDRLKIITFNKNKLLTFAAKGAMKKLVENCNIEKKWWTQLKNSYSVW